MLLGSICSIVHTKQLTIRGGKDLPSLRGLIGATASPGSQTSEVMQWDQPWRSKKSKATGVLQASGPASPVGPFPLPDPDPSGHALLTLDWFSLGPRQTEGAQTGLRSDSSLSTQPSAKQRGWQAEASVQPLTGSRNHAPSSWASTSTEAT